MNGSDCTSNVKKKIESDVLGGVAEPPPSSATPTQPPNSIFCSPFLHCWQDPDRLFKMNSPRKIMGLFVNVFWVYFLFGKILRYDKRVITVLTI